MDNGPINTDAINKAYLHNHKVNNHITQQDSADDSYFDYRHHMPKITIPIYAISAKGDKFISPTTGCQLFFDDFKNPSNVFREYALSHGDLDDYTHSRIMVSRHAATEIWPTVTAWIEKYAN
ncbi:MAG: hypothetical protein L0H34_06500 [Psychrobacter sp.]|nr:hypothetical protein [Psychrobacter sp.]